MRLNEFHRTGAADLSAVDRSVRGLHRPGPIGMNNQLNYRLLAAPMADVSALNSSSSEDSVSAHILI